MDSPTYAIGVDFGTASARTLLLDLRSGEEASVREVAYKHGVIADTLPETGERLPTDWALQDPDDYLAVLEEGVLAVLAERPEAAPSVIGLGIDFTSCTVLPVTAEGVPLCRLPEWRARPHAWTKLWKHHAAQPVASRLNEVASDRGETFLSRYGGRISSEWYFPKLIEIWLEDRAVYDAAARFIEATDWVVWQLTGHERRSACPAAYKALWSEADGVPGAGFFQAAYPGFSGPDDKLGQSFSPLGTSAGFLRPELARRLGLAERVSVAVGNVDSFVSFPGAGAEGTGIYLMVVGTSICDMVVHPEQIALSGITGVAKDGIFPGLYGYEAGQPAVGDMLGWFGDSLARAANPTLADSPAGAGGSGSVPLPSLLPGLERAAAALAPAQTGLVALDWWNGNRSVLADADLSGVIAGLTLQTSAADIYRALMESIAFGNQVILENFSSRGMETREIIACGGVAEKSSLLMQLVADISGLPVKVPASSQVPARGAALFGAVAAGAEAGGFAGIAEAARALRPGTGRHYVPEPRATAVYREVFGVWKDLHDTLGRSQVAWLHELKSLKRRADAAGVAPCSRS
jgi:L-ribulokinase